MMDGDMDRIIIPDIGAVEAFPDRMFFHY